MCWTKSEPPRDEFHHRGTEDTGNIQKMLNTGLERSLFDIMETAGWQILPAWHLLYSSLCLCGELK